MRSRRAALQHKLWAEPMLSIKCVASIPFDGEGAAADEFECERLESEHPFQCQVQQGTGNLEEW